jgi:hypothetical protein
LAHNWRIWFFERALWQEIDIHESVFDDERPESFIHVRIQNVRIDSDLLKQAPKLQSFARTYPKEYDRKITRRV